MSASILTIGDATIDTFLNIHEASVQCDVKKKHCQLCFSYAEKIPIHESIQAAGGNATNVAVGLARLGLKSTIHSEIGADLNGQLVVSALTAAKVNTVELVQSPKTQTRYSVILNFRGERTILSYHPKHVYKPLTLKKKYDWIYYTSLGPTFETIQKSLITYLKKHKTPLIVNPGSYQLKEKLTEFKKILPFTAVLIVNREEAEILAGKTKDSQVLAQKLLTLGPTIVAITDSSRGAAVATAQEYFSAPATKAKVVSTTGAGDAFASGFVAALAQKRNLKTALQWGIKNSGSVVQHFGAQTGLLTELS